MSEDTSGVLATLNQRFGALLVDWLLCLLITWPFGRPGWTGMWALLVLVAEYVFFVGLFGQTPGMRLLGIRCLSAISGKTLGAPRALLRSLLLVLVIPALIMDDYGRGLHDRAAGSVVTKV
jgi:uncharacterized RDD family membrane protein YckC